MKTENPESGLTFKQFTTAVENYFKDHPDFGVFVEERQKLASERRISINAFGRVRTLFGDEASIKRQALNNPIQGSAADFMTDTMILLDEALEGFETAMLLQVHDELIFEVPDEELPIVYPIIKKIMTREIEVNGYRFSIPVDAEIGTHWGNQGAFDEQTFEIVGGSKH